MQEPKREQPIIIEPNTKATAAVIWLHGLGADGNDFAGIVPSLGLPNNHGVRFIFPTAAEQPVTVNGGMVMRSWYDIRTTDFLTDIDAAGIRVSCYHIYDLINVQIKQGIAADKILLAGFSQGGLIALHAGLSFEQQIGGILALSTYCPLTEQFYLYKNMPIMMVHGQFDNVIPLKVANASCKALTDKGYRLDWKTYPMEHQVCNEELEDIAAWFKSTLGL